MTATVGGFDAIREICRSVNLRHDWHKVVYTVIMCYIQLAFGMTCTSVGPCLIDLKNIFKENDIRVVFYYNSINSIGYIVGSLCGIKTKRINRQLRTILLLILLGISLILIPHASLYVLYVCGFVIGVGGGSWDSAFNVWIIEIWQQHSGPFLQLSQFAFGIGSIIGPLIDKPYIIGEPPQGKEAKVDHTDRSSLLSTPFAIIGGIQLLGAMFMTIMFCIRKYEKPEKNEENCVQNSTSAKRVKLSEEAGAPLKTIVMLCAICFASFTAIENCQFQFSPTFNQYIPLRLCAPKTALILSVMASCFTLGRGISIFIAIRLKPETMITYHFCIILSALIILLFASNSLLFIFIGNVLIGIGLSAMWALMLSFIDQYIEITEKIGSILIFSVGVFSTSSPIVIGPFIQSQPMVLIYFSSGLIAVSVLSYITMLYLILNSLERMQNKPFDENRNIERIDAKKP